MAYLELGSVSSGTMLERDLIPVFMGVLKEVNPAECIRLDEDTSYSKYIDMAPDWYDTKDAGYMLDDLFDALNEYCPPYCYFGANEGDGANYGCWISWDSIEDAVRCGELVRVKAGGRWDCVPEILVVTDHGNAELWVWDAVEGKHVEVWSVV